MATDDAYPFGTLICRKNYTDRHIPAIYLGCIPYSFVDSTGCINFVKGGAPVDVIYSIKDQWGGMKYGGLGWDERVTIESRYHPWNPATCGAL